MRSRSFTDWFIIAVAAGVVGLFTVWPTYGPSPRVGRRAAAGAAEEIAAQLAETDGAAEALLVGWGSAEIDPPPGTPLAGYGDRAGAPATGTHDRLHVGAVAISDGQETAMLFSADLLVVPPNIAIGVLSKLDGELAIDRRGVYFTATHTHAGPGASTRGVLAAAFGGRYRHAVETAIVEQFVVAARRALEDLGPAGMSQYAVPVPELIKNRTRDRSLIGRLVDEWVDLVAFRRFDEERQLVLARYSAHATVIGAGFMEFSAGYPGATTDTAEQLSYLRAVEEQVCELLPVLETTVLFAAGAVGSMGPVAPPGASDIERARAMGVELGSIIAEAIPAMDLIGYENDIDVQFAGVTARMPPIQLRVAPGVRLSPLTARLLGLWRTARVSALRLGSVTFVGLPVDVSGELGAAWREEADGNLIMTSFSGGYAGYLSPDAYYGQLYDGDEFAYETGIMSWTGPRQEEYFRALTFAALP